MSEWQTTNIHLQVGGIPNSILFMKILKTNIRFDKNVKLSRESPNIFLKHIRVIIQRDLST